MTLTKKIYKIKKNSFKNLKTKKNKSKKSSIVLQKSKNKHNSLKKNKLIKGGAKSIGESIYINSNYLKCPAISTYVQNLNDEFLKENNIKYRKKIKKIACEFINYKKSLTSNSEQYKNIVDETNFLIFMCYFFDDTEVAYINHKQCKPTNNYYNEEEIEYIKEKCQKKTITRTNNHIYATINNNNTKAIEGNLTWVEFLHTKLTIESNVDTSTIKKIILDTLEKYIKKKIEDKKIKYQNTNIPLKDLVVKLLEEKNTAIEFLSIFDSDKKIAKIIKPNVENNEIYEDSAQFKSSRLNQMAINQKNSTV
jgi:hypothetical protein